MSIMSPTCCILSLPGPLSVPGLNQFLKDNVSLDAASSLIFTALAAKAQPAQAAAPAQAWLLPLQELASAHRVERGSAAELGAYQALVKRQIEVALEGMAGEQPLGLSEQLQKALRLVNVGKTSQGHDLAVELLGFAGLAGLAAVSGPTSSCGGGGSLFKVPALPARKRSSRDEEVQQQRGSCRQEAAQQSSSFNKQQQGGQQQLVRKHSAPKRRATPQVLPGAPICLTPNAPPASNSHGDAVCDEQLLSCWCPISGKRQRTNDCSSDAAEVVFSSTSSIASSDSSASSSDKVTLQAVPAEQQQQQLAANSSKSHISDTVNSLSGASSAPASAAMPAPLPKQPQQQQGLLPPKSGANGSSSGSPSSGKSAAAAARAASHAEAAESLRRLIHEDPRHSQPAADVLLFGKSAQQPIKNWSGTIKHKHAGRVVELCTVMLQVPEPFLEEFPAALYAADLRHRRSVSLGRHVVCRASLGTLSEHQLAGLSAMARGQLVALCSLQTAELHLVPYFDNRNLVRMVGFLKIKAE